jgi:ADP-dependent NAD(P)H-hydrate dehydratase / NAD(P)H-hydrate epimerase
MEIDYKSILLTEEKSKALDNFAISSLNTSGEVLMALAAQSIFSTYKNSFKDYKIIVLSGNGNNGGDGLVLSYLFYQSGFKTEVFLKDGNSSKETNFHKEIAVRSGIEIQSLSKILELLLNKPSEKILIIDAILGTGFKGILPYELQNIVSTISNLYTSNKNIRILNIDTPSGFTGLNDRECMPIDILCEIGIKKIKNQFAIPLCNEYSFHEIGFPIAEFLKGNATTYKTLLDPSLLEIQKSMERDKNSNKYSNGAASFVGGSKGMTGAILLSQKIFHKLGGGISCIYSPSKNLIKKVLQKNPSILIKSIKDKITKDSFYLKSKAIVIGPGLSPNFELKESLLTENSFFILDAGIFIKAKNWDLNRNVLLTPHDGELKKISGKNFDTLENKLDFIREFCISKNTNLLLKGYVNVLGTHDGLLYFRPSANPKLATMGTGDILTGVLAYYLIKFQNIVKAVQYSLCFLDQSANMKEKHPNALEILDYLGETI